MYILFVHSSWLTALKMRAISCDRSDKGVFCDINEVTFGEPLDNLWMGASC